MCLPSPGPQLQGKKARQEGQPLSMSGNKIATMLPEEQVALGHRFQPVLLLTQGATNCLLHNLCQLLRRLPRLLAETPYTADT
jgi:hypothetical protein